MLGFLILFSLFSFLHVFLTNSTREDLIRKYSLFYSGVIFLLSLFLWINFDLLSPSFQYVVTFNWIPFYNYTVVFGVDGLSLFFILLTTLLIFLCILGSWETVKHSVKEYFLCFLALDLLLILVFSVTDVLLFYIFFESILIPMFLVIGVWGSRERKIRAVYLFFFYTLIGSLFMLLAILYIYNQTGTTNYEAILRHSFSLEEQRWLWLAFFFSLASKMPLFPFHVWLPEAHVEAPTAGSVLLAGILLKLGSYGFLRFSLPFFPDASLYFAPFVFTLSVLGIIFTSLTAMRQTDFKRIIAYSSVAHMNLVMMGMFSFHLPGLEGSLLQSLSHGFVASALFFLIGVLYDRYHSRLILYYGGLVHMMPLYTLIFLFFTMANIALPGTSSFIGEFLIISGIYKFNIIAAVLGTTGMILGGGYSLWLYNRISYGNIKVDYTLKFSDLNLREFIIFFPLVLGTLVLGIYPNIVLDFVHSWFFYMLTPFLV
jgi:proton-translocating NADH-quinone oxidoreductase chain M